MITNDDYSAGAGATTNGKIYAGGDIDHQGTATANLYAQGRISRPTSLLNGAKKYSPTTTPNINSQLAPISFSNFTSSLDDLKTAAISGGEYFDASYPVWKFVLLNDGKFTAQGCTLTGGQGTRAALRQRAQAPCPHMTCRRTGRSMSRRKQSCQGR